MTWAICGRKPKLTPEKAAAVRAWAEMGTSIAQVARSLQISPTTVRKYIKGVHKRHELRKQSA